MSSGEAGRVEIWTDGACSGNPGPGGWGAILKFGETVKELNGGEPATTNNRMELLAAIEVERSSKGPKRLAPMLVDLLRRYPLVVYVCASRSVAQGVHDTLLSTVRRPEDQSRLLISVEGERLPDVLLAHVARTITAEDSGLIDRLRQT